MTERQRIAHLLRRFGFGAGKAELDQYAALGYDKALDRLLNFEKVDENFPVDPREFAWNEEKKIDTGTYRFIGWWALRMLLTKRPLQEKLALFWHNHFAISGEKVFDGLSVLHYLDTLRTLGIGRFETLCQAVMKEPAMIVYLDNHLSLPNHPNENLGRELLELFTLGQGNYTETDIRETAKALTGNMVHWAGLGHDGVPYEKIVEMATRGNRGIFTFAWVPDLHIHGDKTILGKTAPFTSDSVVSMLTQRPECARFISKKLWEFFAYEDPEPKVIERFAQVFQSRKGDIRAMLRWMTEQKEFWSDRCVHNMPKSPVDFTLAFYRAIGLDALLLTMRGEVKDPMNPIKPEVKGAGDGMGYLLAQEGLRLLHPDNVGGWDWGRAWITTGNQMIRMRMGDGIFWGPSEDRGIAVWVATRIQSEFKPQNPAEIARAFCEVFDAANLSPEQMAALEKMAADRGGLEAFKNKDATAHLFASLAKVLFAMPEYQLC